VWQTCAVGDLTTSRPLGLQHFSATDLGKGIMVLPLAPLNSPVTLTLLCLLFTTARAGQIKLVQANKCLEASEGNLYSPPTPLHIAPCRATTDRLFGTQLWREHGSIYQIAHARDSRCLHIAHADVGDSQDDNFASDKLVASTCRYTSRDPHPTSTNGMWTALGRVGQYAEGFQRLVFSSTPAGSIVWRGQAKVLPSDRSARYCVEAEGLETGAGVVLAHCEDGNERQTWTYVLEKGEKRDSSLEPLSAKMRRR
jgi:hypothetical protein